MGRPSEYSEAVGAEIVARYASGSTITEIAKMDDMPGLSTIYRWKDCFADFREALIRARENHIEATVDAMQDIADTERDPQRARNRIAVRQFRASKLRPETYGDRLDLNVNGTISVAAALAEARSRARPISDLSEPVECQVIDLPCVSLPRPADAQSSVPPFRVPDPADPAPAPSPAGPSIFD